MHSEERVFLNEEAVRDPDFDELQFVKDQRTTLSANYSRLIGELIGENRELDKANERLMEQIIKLERNAEQMMTTLGDQAATIRRLTEERLGPEKPLYEQAKGLGIGIAPQGTGDPDKGFIK